MKKVVSTFVALAVMFVFSACEKDQHEQIDDFAGVEQNVVELKSVVLNADGGLGILAAEAYAFTLIDGNTFKAMTSYNGNAKRTIADGVFIQKGASIPFDGGTLDLSGFEWSNGNGNTTWVVFEKGATGIVTIAYKWGNVYAQWTFDAAIVAAEAHAVFAFDGRPLSGIAYDVWVPCEVDTKELERALSELYDFIEANKDCLDEDYLEMLRALWAQGDALIKRVSETGGISAKSEECAKLIQEVKTKTTVVEEALEGPHVWKVLSTVGSVIVIQGNNKDQARARLIERVGVPAELADRYIDLVFPAVGEPRSIVILEGIFNTFCDPIANEAVFEMGDVIVYHEPVQQGNSEISFVIEGVTYSFNLGGFPAHAERRNPVFTVTK